MKSYLEIEAPSSTTVSFIVSSKKRGIPMAFVWLGYCLRLVLVFHLLLLNLTKARQSHTLQKGQGYVEALFRLTFADAVIEYAAANIDWWPLGLASATIFWLCLRRPYVEESLLVLQGLGIQTSTSSGYYFVSPTTTFIPTTRIQDIVIHEAFKGLEVKFYLAVIVEDATDLVVVFPTLLPRLDVLQEVWRGARRCLYASVPRPG
jgi:phosphatidylinositol N-acetylglucosaminyltransferase subunit H